MEKRVNSLPNGKSLVLTKFKAFVDDKIIVTQKLKFALGKEENIVGKAFFSRGVKGQECVVKG